VTERTTRQREAIRAAFVQAGRPLSPQEAHSAARYLVPTLGIATVYRTLTLFVEEGLLTAVELPGTIARYELAGLAHHHHFHCRGCGRVYDLQGCPGDLRQLAPPGFALESHEIVLYGRCVQCVTPI
jgi:Fur family ferric uptake transcriptional regulator